MTSRERTILKRKFYAMKARCTYARTIRFHLWGGKGIKRLITFDELCALWKRDNASKLKRPSIDRIDNNGHYTFENCRFIEVKENSRLAAQSGIKPFCKKGHPYDDENTEWYGPKKRYRKCRECHRQSNAITNPKHNPERLKKKYDSEAGEKKGRSA